MRLRRVRRGRRWRLFSRSILGSMPGMNPGNAGASGVPVNQGPGGNPGGAQLHLPNEGGGPQRSPSGPRR